LAGAVSQSDRVEHGVAPPRELLAPEPVQPAEEGEVLARVQVRVDGQVLWHEADGPAGGDARRRDRLAVQRDGAAVDVKGPKGQMKQPLPPGVTAAVEDGTLVTKKISDDKQLDKFHGLARSLVNNAVLGVTEGWKRELDIVGVGYRAEMKGQQVHLALGYSHPVVFDIPKGIDVVIDKQTHITVTGVDRQLVGQVAANLRRLRKPDPYQQKGVRYTGEVLKKKAGKTGA